MWCVREQLEFKNVIYTYIRNDQDTPRKSGVSWYIHRQTNPNDPNFIPIRFQCNNYNAKLMLECVRRDGLVRQ